MPEFPRPILAVHQPNYAPWLGWFVTAAVAVRASHLSLCRRRRDDWRHPVDRREVAE